MSKKGGDLGRMGELLICEGFVDCPLAPSNLVIYKKLMNEAFMSMQSSKNARAAEALGRSFRFLLQELRQANKTASISFITKKSALIHGFIHNMARREIELGELRGEMEQALQESKQWLKAAGSQQPRRPNTISKIYSYIRQMSGSREKAAREKGKLRLETQEEKGAAREIFNKILTPFVNYLLKLTSNFSDYSRILNGKATGTAREFQWKIANWAHLIHPLVAQLIRLGHYFSHDVLGLQVIICYLLTLDLTVYYDASESEIEREAIAISDYKQQQQGANRERQQSKEAAEGEIGLRQQLEELKLLVKESNAMKEILSSIFGNQQLLLWRKFFPKSEYYNYEQSHQNQATQKQILLENIRAITKRDSKREKRGERKPQPDIDAEGTLQELLAKKQNSRPEVTLEENGRLAGEQQEREDLGKMLTLKKTRMMRLNRFSQKQQAPRKSRLEN